MYNHKFLTNVHTTNDAHRTIKKSLVQDFLCSLDKKIKDRLQKVIIFSPQRDSDHF